MKASEKKLDYPIYLILLLAFGLRLNGIQFGLPFLYNPDERDFINPAVNMLATGDLAPFSYGHPGSFVMYCLLVLFALGFAGAWCLGRIESVSQLRELFQAEPTV